MIRKICISFWTAALLASAPAQAQTTSSAAGAAERVLAQLRLMNELVLGAARLADGRALDEDVRDYAERLRRDHSFADKRVRSMALRLDVDLDAAAARMQRSLRSQGAETVEQLERKVEDLVQLQGSAFDSSFVQLMERAHRSAIQSLSSENLHQDPSSGREGASLRDMLSKLIPILKQHLVLAQSLQLRLQLQLEERELQALRGDRRPR